MSTPARGRRRGSRLGTTLTALVDGIHHQAKYVGSDDNDDDDSILVEWISNGTRERIRRRQVTEWHHHSKRASRTPQRYQPGGNNPTTTTTTPTRKRVSLGSSPGTAKKLRLSPADLVDTQALLEASKLASELGDNDSGEEDGKIPGRRRQDTQKPSFHSAAAEVIVIDETDEEKDDDSSSVVEVTPASKPITERHDAGKKGAHPTYDCTFPIGVEKNTADLPKKTTPLDDINQNKRARANALATTRDERSNDPTDNEDPETLVFDVEDSDIAARSIAVVSTRNSAIRDAAQSEHASRGTLDEGPQCHSTDCDADNDLNAEVAMHTSMEMSSSSSSTQQTSFPALHSAYLQPFAEMAHTILEDARWRVDGIEQKQLFRWEDKDDLSSVLALKKLYIPLHDARRDQRDRGEAEDESFVCQCVLCQDETAVAQKVVPRRSTPDSATVDREDPHTHDLARSMQLYCRLFLREGPWFRLDDIYKRYYRPRLPAHQSVVLGGIDQQHPGGEAAIEENLDYSLPQVEEYILKFGQLIQDLHHLSSSGLLRSFASEEECGKTVGESVLTQYMREQLLVKLGKPKKAKNHGRWSNARDSTGGNEVWKQMNQQQSIFACWQNGGASKKRALLPVIKFVDDLILQRIVNDVVACCPRADSKGLTNELKSRFKTSLTTLGLATNGSCWRLRENPAKCLLRCCRLYLCATSGPGDMQGHETNGWKSVEDHGSVKIPSVYGNLKPPGVQSWGSVVFPGVWYRLGLSPAHCIEAYEPLSTTIGDATSYQVFPDKANFWAWEQTVELRSNLDFLLELREEHRREKRDMERTTKSRQSATGENVAPSNNVGGDSSCRTIPTVDFMGLLNPYGGRDELIRTLVSSFATDPIDCSRLIEVVRREIERETKILEGMEVTECDQILVTIAVVAFVILSKRGESMDDKRFRVLASRPWLRHLCWEACLAYVLWEIINVCEMLGLHRLATKGLEVLVHGSIQDPCRQQSSGANGTLSSSFAILLLSRRSRGKAIERLVIDRKHCVQQEAKTLDPKERKSLMQAAESESMKYCLTAIRYFSQRSQIAFSAIRDLARRLHAPLSESMLAVPCPEAQKLGLRYTNIGSIQRGQLKTKAKYSDWTPLIDEVTQNAIVKDTDGSGGRCIYIGNTDNSVNVEERALELYRSGQLPVSGANAEALRGGWVGWHDEGGFVRAVFRILAGAPLLAMDWGCANCVLDPVELRELRLIHLSPYQMIPFDLHVGFDNSNSLTCMSVASGDERHSIRGFYSRNKNRIKSFLSRLKAMTKQEICDAMHCAVKSRLEHVVRFRRKDPWLERDLNNFRTLSLIAAGCGGSQLASMFHCLLFDYRHYSGGLPDLLLARAMGSNNDISHRPLNDDDLSQWIGESFSKDLQEEKELLRGVAMIADEEFLGCRKMSDSAARSKSRQSRNGQHLSRKEPKRFALEDMPQRLHLTFNDMTVDPQCMLVEVKSSSDRLDSRQEDWLNVLDRTGNARVCKFHDLRKFTRKNGNAPK